MKKTLLILVSVLLMSTQVSAQNMHPMNAILVQFKVMYMSPGPDLNPIGNPGPKSPEDAPVVYQEDNVLYFDGDHPSYYLTLRDEDGDTVYTTTVTSTDMTVTLPSTLSGDYEIELVYDSWVFTGWITL